MVRTNSFFWGSKIFFFLKEKVIKPQKEADLLLSLLMLSLLTKREEVLPPKVSLEEMPVWMVFTITLRSRTEEDAKMQIARVHQYFSAANAKFIFVSQKKKIVLFNFTITKIINK